MTQPHDNRSTVASSTPVACWWMKATKLGGAAGRKLVGELLRRTQCKRQTTALESHESPRVHLRFRCDRHGARSDDVDSRFLRQGRRRSGGRQNVERVYFCSSGTLATAGGAGRDWMNAWMFTRSALETTFSVYGGIWLAGRRT